MSGQSEQFKGFLSHIESLVLEHILDELILRTIHFKGFFTGFAIIWFRIFLRQVQESHTASVGLFRMGTAIEYLCNELLYFRSYGTAPSMNRSEVHSAWNR